MNRVASTLRANGKHTGGTAKLIYFVNGWSFVSVERHRRAARASFHMSIDRPFFRLFGEIGLKGDTIGTRDDNARSVTTLRDVSALVSCFSKTVFLLFFAFFFHSRRIDTENGMCFSLLQGHLAAGQEEL